MALLSLLISRMLQSCCFHTVLNTASFKCLCRISVHKLTMFTVTEVRECKGDVEYNVLFLRKKDTPGHIFGFRDRMDTSWITNIQILEKLSEPNMHGRGLLKFESSVPLATD